MSHPSVIVPLAQLSRGAHARIETLLLDTQEKKRLLMLGLRTGMVIRLRMGPDGRGAVLESAGTTIALGREWLDKIQVHPLAAPVVAP